jgi:hypothetical protein
VCSSALAFALCARDLYGYRVDIASPWVTFGVDEKTCAGVCSHAAHSRCICLCCIVSGSVCVQFGIDLSILRKAARAGILRTYSLSFLHLSWIVSGSVCVQFGIDLAGLPGVVQEHLNMYYVLAVVCHGCKSSSMYHCKCTRRFSPRMLV